MWCVPHWAFCEGFFVFVAAIWHDSEHEMVSGPHIPINWIIHRQLHYVHYASMASCQHGVWHYYSGDVEFVLLWQRKFSFVRCREHHDTLTPLFWWCRFSLFKLPWLELNLTNDAALAMRRTKQILCFSLNFFVLLSFLHYPASWPRNLPLAGPCRLLPCFHPCFQEMQLAGQDDSLRVKNAP